MFLFPSLRGPWCCGIQASWFWFASQGWLGGTRGLSEVNALMSWLLRLYSLFIWYQVSPSSHWSQGKNALWIQLPLDQTLGVKHWHLFQLSKISVPVIQMTGDKAGFKYWEGNLNMFQHLLHLEAEMLPEIWRVFSYVTQGYTAVCFSQ